MALLRTRDISKRFGGVTALNEVDIAIEFTAPRPGEKLHEEMIAEDDYVREELAADGSLYEGYHPRMEQTHRNHAARLRAWHARWFRAIHARQYRRVPHQ